VPGPGGPRDRIREDAGARFHSGEQDWAGWIPGPGWTEWPGRRGWEDWARMRGRRGWTGALDFGTFRDLERAAVQFSSDLRKLAMQSGAVGENVISDLRVILEEALERIKTEIFGPPPEAPEGRGEGEAAGRSDVPSEHDTAGQPGAEGQADTASQPGATDAPGPDAPDSPGQPADGTEDSPG
jgi:hypothetical protein